LEEKLSNKFKKGHETSGSIQNGGLFFSKMASKMQKDI
jgi:hypothetical protein